jgi:formyltetrahydrofolate deformylase
VVQQKNAFQREIDETRARLLISCPDKPGIVANVSNYLFEKGANIIQSDQYSTDPEEGRFFMRIEFSLPSLVDRLEDLNNDFEPVARDFQMDWRLVSSSKRKRLAIFVSKADHCLQELLWQWKSNQLDTDIVVVISNHPDCKETVENFGIPFYHIPVTKENKQEVENKQIQILKDYQVDLIALARYMQILTPNFIAQFPRRIINIHHSFLPAFIGANPYARAYDRGVKLIGATAHYVTNDLDEGPIIEQDVKRVYHHNNVNELVRIGSHIERVVLAKAISWHLEDRILVFKNKTIVF